MKYRKNDLLQLVDARIERLRAAHAQKQRSQQLRAEKERRRWNDETAPALQKFSLWLQYQAEHHMPITEDDVKAAAKRTGLFNSATRTRGYWGLSELIVVKDEAMLPDFEPPAELSSFRAFLDSIVDDEVSSTALNSAGYRNLGRLLHG